MPFSLRSDSLLEGRAIGGLSPREWIIVDQGVSREEVKEFYLSRGIGFTAQSILDVAGFCRHVLGAQVEAKRVLSAAGRQEVLRRILCVPSKTEHLREIRRLKRQKGFYKKLDRSLQKARASYSSLDELSAQLERLAISRSRHPTRDELRWVIQEYETWLAENRAWDGPRLLLGATAVLSMPEIPLILPEKILVLSASRGEGRTEAFWEALGRRVVLERVILAERETTASGEVTWEVWHTIDDAVEMVADGLAEAALAGELHRHGVLIPDLPVIRRSLNRALRERGVLPEDPRDPTRLKFEEGVKQAFLPLDLVSRDFEREFASSYLLSPFCSLPVEMRKKLEQEIEDQGVLRGWASYSSAEFQPLRMEWERIRSRFSERMSVTELKDVHLELLETAGELRLWVRDFFQAQWEAFESDLLVVEGRLRNAPPRYWIERLRTRVEEASPPVERVKWRGGLALYRLGQRPIQYPENLWAIGLPARYTTEEERGDYWLSARERDLLSGHFLFRSSHQSSVERKQELLTWFSRASRVRLFDAQYDFNGRERESLRALLQELGISVEAQEKGAHPRWLSSYSPPVSAPPREFEIAPLDRAVISASELENASRCEFRGMIMGRWKLKEAQEADLDLRADARGTLLHEAIRIFLSSCDEGGRPSRDLDEILEEAWRTKRPKGVFKSARLTAELKSKLRPVLAKFAEQEAEYRERSKARVHSLEGPELRLKVGDVEIKGIPDRIDEVGDGLMLVDFKTSSSNPSGKAMIEHGYRLQMPIYALAAQAQLGKPVVAAQFIELSKKGGRGKGIFPVAVIGEEPGQVVKLTKRSQSYIEKDAQEIWSELAEQVEKHLDRYRSGRVRAEPKPVQASNPYLECATCPVLDLCGQRRFAADDEGEGDE